MVDEQEPPDLDRALAEGDVLEFAALVRARNAVKKLGPLRSHPLFAKAHRRAVRAWRDVPAAERAGVLVALGLVARLAHKKNRPEIDALYGTQLVPPFPSLLSLVERDDREWAAEALYAVPGAEAASVLAEVIALEETAESSRETALCGLLRNRASVGPALEDVATALAAWNPDTIDLAKTRCLRLARILRALPRALASLSVARSPRVRPGIDDSAGPALAGLVTSGLRRAGSPQGEPRDELTRALMAALAELIARRFSVCTRPATFAPVGVCEGWYRPSEWGEACSEIDEVDSIRASVQEAILLLARQDVVDDELWRQFARLAGSERSAREFGREIAASDTSLPARARAWLLGERKPLVAPEASDFSTNDLEVLAQAWVDLEMALRGADELTQRVRDEIAFSAPALLSRLERQQGVSMVALEAVRRLARRHRLSLVGEPGDVAPFSPKQHRPRGQVATQDVRLVRPGVLWHRADQVTEIVLRAEVEEP